MKMLLAIKELRKNFIAAGSNIHCAFSRGTTVQRRVHQSARRFRESGRYPSLALLNLSSNETVDPRKIRASCRWNTSRVLRLHAWLERDTI